MSDIINKEKSNWELFLEIIYGAKTINKKLPKILILTLLYIIFLVVDPYFYKLFIDNIEVMMRSDSLQNTALQSLISLSLIWGGFVILSLFVAFFYRYAMWQLNNDEWQSFSDRLAHAFLSIEYNYHISVNIGERTKNYDRGPVAVSRILERTYAIILPQALLFLGLLFLGFIVNWRMMFVIVGFFPLIFIISIVVGKKVHLKQKDVNDLWDKSLGRFTDSLQNIAIIKLFAREKKEETIVQNLNSTVINEQLKINILWGILDVGSGFIDFLVRTVVMITGVFFILHGFMTLGELFLFVTLAGRIFAPLNSIESAYRETIQRLADYGKMHDLLQKTPEKDTGTKTLSKIKKSITFKNLSFAYPSSPREVLSDIDFTITKGERIALIGHTGSGKSTIIQLLMRFYEPNKGNILIDGMDIYDFTLESYRGKFAAVFQDTTLFNETIRHNLEYVRDGITDKMLQKACKEANILEFIESLPEGWETQVGERGLKLSGGEKQRIAIARAILADPEILILDEATSALDTKTERLVQDAFDHLMDGRTSIIIAHRLSTIMSADTIYLMDKGRIVAKGSHAELYRLSPEYKEMVDLQHDGFVGEEVEEEIV